VSSGQLHAPAALLPSEQPPVVVGFGCVGPGTGLDTLGKSMNIYFCRKPKPFPAGRGHKLLTTVIELSGLLKKSHMYNDTENRHEN
jgi:hypothetical protein